MQKTINSYYASNQKQSIAAEILFPDTCPHCKKGVLPILLGSYYSETNLNGPDDDAYSLFSVFFCPVCKECFIGVYSLYIDHFTAVEKPHKTNLSTVFPHAFDRKEFSNGIHDLSPDFINIYNQSLCAESNMLTEVCGLGYRKSLEFLIKDYAIYLFPDNEEAIKREPLSPCITKYIKDERIKSLATASAWLGNDETHYVRKHCDYGIDHLKSFINAVVTFIDSDLAFIEASRLLKTPK